MEIFTYWGANCNTSVGLCRPWPLRGTHHITIWFCNSFDCALCNFSPEREKQTLVCFVNLFNSLKVTPWKKIIPIQWSGWFDFLLLVRHWSVKWKTHYLRQEREALGCGRRGDTNPLIIHEMAPKEILTKELFHVVQRMCLTRLKFRKWLFLIVTTIIDHLWNLETL